MTILQRGRSMKFVLYIKKIIFLYIKYIKTYFNIAVFISEEISFHCYNLAVRDIKQQGNSHNRANMHNICYQYSNQCML